MRKKFFPKNGYPDAAASTYKQTSQSHINIHITNFLVMKNIVFALATLIACLFNNNANAANGPLPAGTLVILEIAEQINSASATIGKTVLFRVRTNVVVDGKPVIVTGAIAIGRVKNITPATFNNPEQIAIELLYAQAVDGQQVPLYGNEQTYKGKFAGESVIVEPGHMLTATVMNNINIKN